MTLPNKMMDYKSTFLRYSKRRFFRYGVPFFIFVIGGSFALREFAELRYRYRTVISTIRDEISEVGIEMKKPGEVTLESEYEKIKTVDIEKWENVRIPRPWEKDGKEI